MAQENGIRSAEPPSDSPETADPVEIAMGLERQDRASDSPARQLLVKQGRLLDLQARRENLQIWVQALLILVGTVLVLSTGFALWRASQDRSIVVRPFTVPAAYAEKGLTGEAAALRLVANMAAIREVTARTSFLATNRIRDDSDALSVEIAQTGLSIEDVSRLLGRWLGNQTQVVGQIVDEGDGKVTLVLRSSRHGVSVVSGPADQLNTLFVRLAETAFARAEPTNWVQYLKNTGRYEEALGSARRLVEQPQLSDLSQAYNYSLWANVDVDPRESLRLGRRSLDLDPTIMPTWINVVRAQLRLGHDAAALADAQRLMALKDSDQEARFRSATGRMRGETQSRINLLLGDYRDIGQDDGANPALPPLFHQALTAARAHDAGLARRLLQDGVDQQSLSPEDIAQIQAEIALARGDGLAALNSVNAMESAMERASVTPIRPGGPQRQQIRPYQRLDEAVRRVIVLPLKARALIAAGQTEQARLLLMDSPGDAYQPTVARGEAASALGDWAAADALFARAQNMAPSLPWAHLAQARSQLARGDLDGADKALVIAARISPQLSEVRMIQGEVALKRGDLQNASKTFEAAARRAPHWGRLHLVWGEAESRRRQAKRASSLWTQALGMDLSPADRARLQKHLNGL